MVKGYNDITIKYDENDKFFEMIINGVKVEGVIGFELTNLWNEASRMKLEIYVKSLNYERGV